MAYSFAQLEGLWIQAGGNRRIAPVMAAIALAESGGNPNATGGVGEKGLWQINPHAWGSLATYDPLGNARAAVHVLSAQGLSAWTTYTSGAYKHFLGSAAPQGAPTGTGTGGGTTAGSRGSGGTSGTPGSADPGSTTTGRSGSSSLDRWLNDIANVLDFGAVSGVTGVNPAASALLIDNPVAKAIAGLTLPFVKIAEAIDWLLVPSHWIRIIAGVAGLGLAGFGGYELTQTGEKPAALPMGIASVGVGGVLLFVAFHNLDPNIKTVGELLSDLQGKVQSPGSVSPAAAVTAAGG